MNTAFLEFLRETERSKPQSLANIPRSQVRIIPTVHPKEKKKPLNLHYRIRHWATIGKRTDDF